MNPLNDDTGATSTPLPQAPGCDADARVVRAWCEWLSALATDAEAAMAAALAYEQLDAVARESWIAALSRDAHCVEVPRIALYAPLLAVESDADRRARIELAAGPVARSSERPRALRGMTSAGLVVATVVAPLYLGFVQVLGCAFVPGERFEWARHDPIVSRDGTPTAGDVLCGARLDRLPLKALVDELALTIVAHGRTGAPLPEPLRLFSDLFDQQPESESVAAATP